jgi:hypothetical protein
LIIKEEYTFEDLEFYFGYKNKKNEFLENDVKFYISILCPDCKKKKAEEKIFEIES